MGAKLSKSRRKLEKLGKKCQCFSPQASAGNTQAHDNTHAHADTDTERSESTRLATRRGAQFHDDWVMGKQLGDGVSAVVYECTHKVTGQRAAVKVVDLTHLTASDMELVRGEITVMKALKSHRHVVQLLDVYEARDKVYMVLELCKGGDLLTRIIDKRHYCEKDARDVTRPLLEVLKHCHERRIVHRDIKPENLLLVDQENDTLVKVADFGFARQMKRKNACKRRCGSPDYMPPEVLKGVPYGTEVDMWSSGVVLYVLLGGYSPWQPHVTVPVTDRRYFTELFKFVRQGMFDFEYSVWNKVSEEAKDLICKLLVVDPKERLTAEQALQHPWMQAPDTVLLKRDLSQTQLALRSHVASMRWKRATHAIIAIHKLRKLSMSFSRQGSTESAAGTVNQVSSLIMNDGDDGNSSEGSADGRASCETETPRDDTNTDAPTTAAASHQTPHHKTNTDRIIGGARITTTTPTTTSNYTPSTQKSSSVSSVDTPTSAYYDPQDSLRSSKSAQSS